MKALYISFFVLAAFLSNAQNDLYNKVNSYLNTNTKEVVTNRMIAINVWSSDNKNSRDLNAEFEKVYKTYEYAKLKGGNKGIIVLNVNLDNDAITSTITAKKDGIIKSITIPNDNTEILKELKGKSIGYNIVFDSNGNMIYENLSNGTVFDSIHQLITR